MKTNQEQNKQMKEAYQRPQVEIIEMETESPILQASAPGYIPGGGN